jgi:hypothetical protein
MFARVIEYTLKPEKKDEAIKMVHHELLPFLKMQPGFLELIPLVPEITNEKFISIALWTGKTEAERFAREEFPKVEQMLKPFVTTPLTVKTYTVESSICEYLVDTLLTAA